MDEAAEELEVLRSIYDERVEELAPGRLRVSGVLGRGVALALEFELPTGYPLSSEPPAVSVSVSSGRLPVGGTEMLLAALREEAARQQGMPLIFALVSAAEEWLTAQNAAPFGATSGTLSPQANVMAKAPEDTQPDGPLLTSEEFSRWWSAFRDGELRAAVAAEEDALWALEHPGESTRPASVADASAAHPPTTQRRGAVLTGKQLFEQGRVRADAAGDAAHLAAGDECDALEDLSALDATAFDGLDDLDICED